MKRLKEGRVDARERIRAPIAAVFEALSDHEGMARWPGIGASSLLREGTPRNGVGALRRITAGGLTLDEEVVAFEPPRRLEYTIRRGLPVTHLGIVTLVEDGDVVEVRWQVEMSSSWPLLCPAVAVGLRWGLRRALRHVRAELERR